MRKRIVIAVAFSAVLIITGANTKVLSQNYHPTLSDLRASNCNCYILTNRNSIGSFSWSGSCANGYCDGYGRADFYDLNGNPYGYFVGNYAAGLRSGFGTFYYPDGVIGYQGKYIRSVMVDEEPYSILNKAVGDLVIDSLLMGGIRRHCEITQSIFSSNGELIQLRYAVSCYGQYDNSNFYGLNIVITPNTTVPVHFENVNDNAQTMIALKSLIWGKRLYDWLEQQLSENNGN